MNKQGKRFDIEVIDSDTSALIHRLKVPQGYIYLFYDCSQRDPITNEFPWRLVNTQFVASIP